MRCILSSTASGIAITPTPLSVLQNIPTPISNLEAHTIITNPLQMGATEHNQRQSEWQLQPQAVSTPRSIVSGSCSVYRFDLSDMTRLVFGMGRLLKLYILNRWPFMSASHLEMVSYATRCVLKAFAEATHWQIIETNWNSTM